LGWEDAGAGWGARAKDWAYLFEPYSLPVNEQVFDALDIGNGIRLLDVACGSGFAAQLAGRRGAIVSGLDAAASLIAIAKARSPEADFRTGDMFAMPFEDASFDAVTSFNGIWKGCEGALEEAHRVLVPGGRVGLTFWGSRDRFGLRPWFLKLVELSPPDHVEANRVIGDTGRVIESMLESTGFELVDRGAVISVNEWPDVDTAVRALSAAGPAVPAIEAVGYERFVDALREVMTPYVNDQLGIRIGSEVAWVTATAV
jgi:SAM-dependent methyltransferase